MTLGALVPPILNGKTLSWPANFVEYLVLVLAICATATLVYMLVIRTSHLTRFAFQLALLINLCFQWPAALTSHAIAATLQNSTWYQVSINVTVFTLATWVLVTKQYSTPANLTGKFSPAPRGTLIVPGALLLFCVGAYLMQVPAACTGLYAFLTDPQAAGLAREVSVNLVQSGIVTTMLMIGIEIAIPIVAALSLSRAIVNARSRKYTRMSAWILLCCCVWVLALLPGIKGLLIPTGVVLATSMAIWIRRIPVKILLTLAVLFATGLGVVSFDTLSERPTQLSPYNFSKCAVAVGAQNEARQLLEHLTGVGGFGLSATEITEVMNSGTLGNPSNSSSASQEPSSNSSSASQEPSSNSSSASQEPSSNSSSQGSAHFLGRFIAYARGTFNRAFLVPSSVAVLHFKYVEDFGSPGFRALPLAQKIFGSSIDVPNIVFRNYVAAASTKSNQELSGTAPTSSAIAWPAYFGVAGLIVALLVAILVDGIIVYSRRRMHPVLGAIALGISISGAILFSTADYFTAMTSHGFVVGLAIMLFWSRWTAIDPIGKLSQTGPLMIRSQNPGQS